MTDNTMGYGLKDALMGGPGLDGYAYRADVYCVDCGRDIIREVFTIHANRTFQRELPEADFRDSERLPQPIFCGEADYEVHCATCGEYLYGEHEADEDYPDDEPTEAA